MKLYGFGPTRSLRALWGLKELDTDFEFIPINLLAGEHKHPDFLRLNPAGKVRCWSTVTSSSRNRPRSCCISPTNIARRGFCQPACRKERRSIAGSCLP